MADMLLRDTAPETLAAAVAEMVLDRLRPMLSETTEPRLVDRFRMAELLSISVPMLDRLTAAGDVPSIRLGTRRLYAPAAVIAALESNKNAPAGE